MHAKLLGRGYCQADISPKADPTCLGVQHSCSCAGHPLPKTGLCCTQTRTQVLSTLGACELKHALRKLHKAGNRKAVLHGLVEQAGVAADRKLLETCIVYGTAEQVRHQATPGGRTNRIGHGAVCAHSWAQSWAIQSRRG